MQYALKYNLSIEDLDHCGITIHHNELQVNNIHAYICTYNILIIEIENDHER